jgi:hypothetical protein
VRDVQGIQSKIGHLEGRVRDDVREYLDSLDLETRASGGGGAVEEMLMPMLMQQMMGGMQPPHEVPGTPAAPAPSDDVTDTRILGSGGAAQ